MTADEMHVLWMQEALCEAEKAYAAGEVPIGAVLVSAGKVIARAHNLRETEKTALGHAELLAIADGCRSIGDWRLSDATLYVTLEPCPMCAGAIVNARIPHVVYGASDAVMGAMGSVLSMQDYPFPVVPIVAGGVCADECRELLTRFFTERRKGNK